MMIQQTGLFSTYSVCSFAAGIAGLCDPTNMAGENMDIEAKVEMNGAVAMQYDIISKILEEITGGDHFHLGFYDSSSTISGSDVHAAQTRMIEAALCFASVSEDPSKIPRNILDVGCGIGGSTRYLARKYGAQCKGIAISPVEIERARLLTAAQGIESRVSFEVADALNQPFPDGQFDLIWCIECAEHISDKTKFVQELARVAAPGATIILLSWCHRELSPEQDLHQDEEKLLNALYNVNRCKWCSAADYINLFKSCSFQDIKSADWSPQIAPFYSEMRKLTLSWKGIVSYIRNAGWKQVSAKMLMMPSPFEKYKNGLIKYCIFTCKKPE